MFEITKVLRIIFDSFKHNFNLNIIEGHACGLVKAEIVVSESVVPKVTTGLRNTI